MVEYNTFNVMTPDRNRAGLPKNYLGPWWNWYHSRLLIYLSRFESGRAYQLWGCSSKVERGPYKAVTLEHYQVPLPKQFGDELWGSGNLLHGFCLVGFESLHLHQIIKWGIGSRWWTSQVCQTWIVGSIPIYPAKKFIPSWWNGIMFDC